MGDIFGGSKQTQTTNSTQQTTPWAPQIPYLMSGFNAAQDIFNAQKNNPFYQGALYASLNPQQKEALSSLTGFASGQGSALANSLATTGQSLLPSLTDAQTGAQAVLSRALADPTQTNITDASQYANNPYTQGMITAANRPIEQQLNEVALPTLNRTAIGSGNLNSSRSGVAEAILRREAAKQEADNTANILGNQFNTGLNLSEAARTSGLTSGLSASNTLGTLGTTGANLTDTGYTDLLHNLSIPLSAGTIEQQDAQNQDTANYQAWQAANQFPWQALNNYWNIVGRPLGQTTTGNSTQEVQGGGPGVLGGLLGLASTVGSFFMPTGPFGQGLSMFDSIKKAF